MITKLSLIAGLLLLTAVIAVPGDQLILLAVALGLIAIPLWFATHRGAGAKKP